MSAHDNNPHTITPRDLSYFEAQAGAFAAAAASAAGGDAAQLRALVAAALAEEEGKANAPSGAAPTLKGLPLRGEDLLVSMCFKLHAAVFGADPRAQLAKAQDGSEVSRLQAIAALALIFTQPDKAFDYLDRAADAELAKEDAAGWARDFRLAAVAFAGEFGEKEILLIGQHILDIARRNTSSAAEGDTPGK